MAWSTTAYTAQSLLLLSWMKAIDNALLSCFGLTSNLRTTQCSVIPLKLCTTVISTWEANLPHISRRTWWSLQNPYSNRSSPKSENLTRKMRWSTVAANNQSASQRTNYSKTWLVVRMPTTHPGQVNNRKAQYDTDRCSTWPSNQCSCLRRYAKATNQAHSISTGGASNSSQQTIEKLNQAQAQNRKFDICRHLDITSLTNNLMMDRMTPHRSFASSKIAWRSM